VLWYVLKRKEQVASLQISSIKGFSKSSLLPKLKPLLFLLRLLQYLYKVGLCAGVIRL